MDLWTCNNYKTTTNNRENGDKASIELNLKKQCHQRTRETFMQYLPSCKLLSFPNDDIIFGEVIVAGEAKNILKREEIINKLVKFLFFENLFQTTITLLRIS